MYIYIFINSRNQFLFRAKSRRNKKSYAIGVAGGVKTKQTKIITLVLTAEMTQG
jgi:hypothetical protein